MPWTREQIAARAIKELGEGWYVNLGIGIPTLIAAQLPDNLGITLQSENGMLGLGPYPTPDAVDPDLINAGKETITELPGTSYVSSAESFAMVRGGHMNATVLGSLEVSEDGNMANWIIPGKMVKGMGGAMDLVSGTRRVIVLMDHVARDGSPKFRKQCTLPLTGLNVVDTLITDLAVFKRTDRKGYFKLAECAPGVTVEDVKSKTEAHFEV
ncbi:MAG TPA: 3-oxoacid CoA-transferase subunit B [Novosphingobium sp.]|nr:3-oxoacid CoA-transferase subunit B [Novosphingobium sp.]